MQAKIKTLKQCTCLRKIQDINISKNSEECKEKVTPNKTLDLQNDKKGAREIISNLTVLEDQMKNLLIEEVIFIKNLKIICHSHSNWLCAALYFYKFNWIPYIVQHEIKLLKSLCWRNWASGLQSC